VDDSVAICDLDLSTHELCRDIGLVTSGLEVETLISQTSRVIITSKQVSNSIKIEKNTAT